MTDKKQAWPQGFYDLDGAKAYKQVAADIWIGEPKTSTPEEMAQLLTKARAFTQTLLTEAGLPPLREAADWYEISRAQGDALALISRQMTYSFGSALALLQKGQKLTRRGWNARHVLTLQVPDAHSKMTLPYIYITTVQGDRVPWVASQADLLATDWQVA